MKKSVQAQGRTGGEPLITGDDVKTESIPMEVIGGHVILHVGGVRTFLDTGSQVSFGDVSSLRILGKDHQIEPLLLGRIGVVELRDGLRRSTPVPPSFDFHALLGLDLLAGQALELDWERSELRLWGRPRRQSARRAPPSLPGGTIEVEGTVLRAALDTGAWRTYLVPEATDGLPRVGVFEDYNPILGVLRPELVHVRARFLGTDQELVMGVAPAPLADVIRALGAKALVGNDVMTRAGTVRMEIGDS